MKITNYSISYTQPKPFQLLVCDNEDCKKYTYGGYSIGSRSIQCRHCKQDLSLVPNSNNQEGI